MWFYKMCSSGFLEPLESYGCYILYKALFQKETSKCVKLFLSSRYNRFKKIQKLNNDYSARFIDILEINSITSFGCCFCYFCLL